TCHLDAMLKYILILSSPEINELEPSGHLDFYPNGGRRPHGCSHPLGEHHSHHDIGCEIVPSWQLYIESINTDCPFFGYVCDNFRNFSAAKCVDGCGDGSLCAPLGHRANEWQQYKKAESVKMYLFAGHSTPACRYHYYVKAQVSESNDADDEDFKARPPQGLMFIQLTGSKKHIGPLQARKSNQKDVECLVSSKDLGSIIRTDVKWQPGHSPPFDYNFFGPNEFGVPYPPRPFIPKPPALRVERFEVTNLENGISEQFCAIGKPILYPNQVKPFFKGGECAQP
ncbi:hepatic triacylglycerol lipase-like, partial [Limulus polyphemus]|uniref:Hepatic triacylglycerol lipase-like n=1 Tax=Limulus polyphemus TaxID=6850 RepID=A0ABM1RW18_LIMPO